MTVSTTDNAPKDPTIKLSNKLYDFLKTLAQVILPAAATGYSAIAALWGWGAVTQVVGTIVAVDTFLGVVLSLLNKQYMNSDAPYDGVVSVTPNPDTGTGTLSMNLTTHPDDIAAQGTALLKVVPESQVPSSPSPEPNGY